MFPFNPCSKENLRIRHPTGADGGTPTAFTPLKPLLFFSRIIFIAYLSYTFFYYGLYNKKIKKKRRGGVKGERSSP
jgi:hypothetical protein